jgi:hypothetical protein
MKAGTNKKRPATWFQDPPHLTQAGEIIVEVLNDIQTRTRSNDWSG